MTAHEATQNVEDMRREAKPDVQKRLLSMALGRFGNLSDAAKAVYTARLAELET